jgi:isopentenyldiphosphate isomerase
MTNASSYKIIRTEINKAKATHPQTQTSHNSRAQRRHRTEIGIGHTGAERDVQQVNRQEPKGERHIQTFYFAIL